MFKTSKTIGKNTLEISADDLKKLCFLSSQVPNLDRCDLCDSDNIGLSGREVNGDAYYAIRCGSCGAEYKLGQKKQGGLLFFKEGTKFEKYTPKDAQPIGNAPQYQKPTQPEDVPNFVDNNKAPWE